MAYNTSVHPTTGFTPFYLMFGWQAKLPVELMYGAPETEAMSPSQYAKTLKASLGEAYTRVRKRTTRQLERQKELYNRRVQSPLPDEPPVVHHVGGAGSSFFASLGPPTGKGCSLHPYS